MKNSIVLIALVGGLSIPTYSQFFVHQSNGRVGIGNTSPGYPLDVSGVVNATAFYVNGVPFAGGGSQWISSGTIIYYNAGDVGIGTATPSNIQGWDKALDVRGNSHSKILATAASGTHRTGIFSNAGWHGGAGFIGTESNHDLHLITNYTSKATILANGDVGIGTISPSSRLDVNGTARLQAIVPAANNTYDIGTTANAFKDIHLDGKILFEDDKRIAMPDENTFFGYRSGINNTTGYGNSFYGYEAGQNNTTGYSSTSVGRGALTSNTVGYGNTALGTVALLANTSGVNNTSIGVSTLAANTTGSGNTAVGTFAVFYNNGDNNTGLGNYAGPSLGTTNLANTTALGYNATPTASNQVRVGNSSVTSIGGQVSWSTLSDGRFKNDVKENVAGLDFISQLRPVSYIVNEEAYNTFLGVKPEGSNQTPEAIKIPIRQTGFVAQEVEAIIKKSGYVFHGIEIPQNEKDPYTIRYGEFVVPLVKAVQELNAKVEEQQKTIEQLLHHGNNTSSGEQEQNAFTGVNLFQNNPNPFSLDTKIKMNLPEKVNQAMLIIYNLEGKQLKDIPVRERGNTEVIISGYELSAGMYIYALIADNNLVATKRMILTK